MAHARPLSPAFLPLLPFLALALGACRSAAREETSPPAWRAPFARNGPVAALSVEGRPLEVFVHGRGPRTVLLLATLHGDEAAGTPLLEALVARLRTSPRWLDGVRVVVVPVANPDGRARGTRTNARGVDLNRNFPASNRAGATRGGPFPLSEPETRFLARLVGEYEPARILSFHQPLRGIDWDGPAEELARAMAAVSPLATRRLGSRPGSLGSWAGVDLGRPVVTVELPRDADRLDPAHAWVEYGALVREGLRF